MGKVIGKTYPKKNGANSRQTPPAHTQPQNGAKQDDNKN